jgi:hypothetical protein
MAKSQLEMLYDQLGRLRAGREGFSTVGYTAQQVTNRYAWYDSRIKAVQKRINDLRAQTKKKK